MSLIALFIALLNGSVPYKPATHFTSLPATPRPAVIKPLHRRSFFHQPRLDSETQRLKRTIRDLKHVLRLGVLMRLTGYSLNDPGQGTGSLTALGTQAGPGQVAVDPAVIPLGTEIWIPNYGLARATDTGGAIRGNHIDLCFGARDEAIEWGIRTETVYPIPPSLSYLFT
jgi:3D (Asp-Asp-Asp) domain-containing protein